MLQDAVLLPLAVLLPHDLLHAHADLLLHHEQRRLLRWQWWWLLWQLNPWA